MTATLTLGKFGDTIDLHGGDDGIRLTRGGWLPTIPTEENGEWPTRIQESIIVNLVGASHDNIAAILQQINGYFEDARRYVRHPTETIGVYLTHKLTNETGSRESLVLNGQAVPLDSLHSPPVDPGNFVPRIQIGLERMPFWEGGSGSISGNGVGTVGGTYDYGSGQSIAGLVPARPSILAARAGATGYAITKVWIGFKTDESGGDYTAFEPVWECEDGTAGTDTSTRVGGSAYSGGYYMQCNFGVDATMATRITIEVEDVVASASNYQHQRGEYRILLRAVVDTDSAHVRLRAGFSSSSQWETYGRVKVDGTSFEYYDLGIVSIPGDRSEASLAEFALQIQAEQVGSAILGLDCLVLIPVDEGEIFIDNANVQDHGSSVENWTRVQKQADDVVVGDNLYDTASTSSVGKSRPDVRPRRWGIPTGAGVMIVAAQRSSSQVITDTLDIVIGYRSRWLLLRGSS